jgi:hypothetical protein
MHTAPRVDSVGKKVQRVMSRNEHTEFLERLSAEAWYECLASHTFDTAEGYLNELEEELERPTVLLLLFWRALKRREWWIAERCIASGLPIAGDDVWDFFGEAILIWSMNEFKDCPTIVGWLIDHGAEIEARSLAFRNHTPLMYAVGHGLPSVASLLIMRGANVNASSEIDDAESSLMVAIKADKPAMAELLLANGADSSFQDRRGLNAASIADRLDRWWFPALLAKRS